MGVLFEGLDDEISRRVFFSFHYERDIFRVQTVKNHWITKGTQTAAGFFDSSLEEEAKTKGNEAVKRLINGGLKGASVTCVLIGNETYQRRWVDYEILKSISEGMGVFGVRIHQITCMRTKRADLPGSNPFQFLGLFERQGSDKLWGGIQYKDGWQWSDLHSDGINRSASQLVPNYGQLVPIGDVLKVYDWVDDDGYSNFANWVRAAARQAGR